MQLCNKCSKWKQLYLSSKWTFSPVSLIHCCYSISTKDLFGYFLVTIFSDKDCIWVGSFNFIYFRSAYPKSSLRSWTDSVSFCIHVSERCLLIAPRQRQVQMERRVPRSEKYARGGRELNNRSTWKASGLTGPVSACTGNYSNTDVPLIMWKTPTRVTSLGKDYLHSSWKSLIKDSAMSHCFQSCS